MKPQFARFAAAALLTMALAGGAQAQTTGQPETMEAPATRIIGGPLANVKVVQMSVAPLSEASRTCGFQESLIIDSFQEPLAQEGITVQRSAHIWLQLEVTTLRYDANICISYMTARALQNTRYFDRLTNTDRSGRVLTWEDGGLFVTGLDNHGVVTNIGWRDLARNFVKKWRMDQ
jgi:hypothetical protein